MNEASCISCWVKRCRFRLSGNALSAIGPVQDVRQYPLNDRSLGVKRTGLAQCKFFPFWAMCSVLTHSKARPLLRTAHAIRAWRAQSPIRCGAIVSWRLRSRFVAIALPTLDPDQHDPRGLHEQRAQVAIAALIFCRGSCGRGSKSASVVNHRNKYGMSDMRRVKLVALHSDFDRLGPAVRLAPAGVSDQ
jgi:hypothetical protein